MFVGNVSAVLRSNEVCEDCEELSEASSSRGSWFPQNAQNLANVELERSPHCVQIGCLNLSAPFWGRSERWGVTGGASEGAALGGPPWLRPVELAGCGERCDGS